MTLSKIIEQLKAADQNKSGMFELGEDVMCALVDLLERRERDGQEPVAHRKLFTCSGCGAEGLDEPLESKCHCNEDGAHWIEGKVFTAPPALVGTSEPVRYMNRYTGACYTFEQQPDAATDTAVYVPLYTEQPAPVVQPVQVPDAIEPTLEAIKAILPTANPDEYACCVGADMWNACRAAMLKGGQNNG